MADMQKLSRQMIEYAERFADVTDAAKGHNRRSGGGTRWLILPAAGAGLYALFTSKRTKEAMDEAKTRASGLPDDLVKRVRQTTQSSSDRSSSRSTTAKSSSRSPRTRSKTSSARKSSSSR